MIEWTPRLYRHGLTLYVMHVGRYTWADVKRTADGKRCVRGGAYSVRPVKALIYDFIELVTPEFGATLATATAKTPDVVRCVEELEAMLRALDGTHIHEIRARRLLGVDASEKRRYTSLR